MNLNFQKRILRRAFKEYLTKSKLPLQVAKKRYIEAIEEVSENDYETKIVEELLEELVQGSLKKKFK